MVHRYSTRGSRVQVQNSGLPRQSLEELYLSKKVVAGGKALRTQAPSNLRNIARDSHLRNLQTLFRPFFE